VAVILAGLNVGFLSYSQGDFSCRGKAGGVSEHGWQKDGCGVPGI
jgi:hypothetical protein